jgi:hypothetical protein
MVVVMRDQQHGSVGRTPFGCAVAALFVVVATLAALVSSNPAAAVINHNPVGTFNVAFSGAQVHFYGTASDPDTTRPIDVQYLLNGKLREVWPTNAQHAYSRVWTLGYGTWTIQVRALNVGPGTANPIIGADTVTGGALPLGYSAGTATRVITVKAGSAVSTTATLQAWSKLSSGRWSKFGGPVLAHIGAQGVGATREGLSRTPAG